MFVAGIASVANTAMDLLYSSSSSSDESCEETEQCEDSDSEEDGRRLTVQKLAGSLVRRKIPKLTGGFFTLMEEYDEIEFIRNMRMNRETLDKVVEIILHFLPEGPNEGNVALPPYQQIVVGLWYIFNKESFRALGARFGISPSSCINYQRRVVKALLQVKDQFLHWPDDERLLSIQHGFQEKSGIPDCCGAIDGKHIRIVLPKHRPEDYINRKKFPSIVLQATCDHELLFTSVYCGWPGSVHDARVFRNSPLIEHLQNRHILPPNKFIVGDSAYPLSEKLLTPFKNYGNLTREQSHYNYIQSSTRNVIERAFGQLTARCRSLQSALELKLKYVPNFVLSCCILHNICIRMGDFLNNNEICNEDDEDVVDGDDQDNDGRRRRDEIMAFVNRNNNN